jgi:hypothetical protein
MDDGNTQDRQTRWIAIGLVAVLALGAGAWWYWQHSPAVEMPAAAASLPATAAAAAEGPPATPEGIQHPLTDVPGTDAAVTAPEVADPDAAAAAGLTALFGEQDLAAWLIPETLLRRLVATTDNLSRNTRTESLRPLRAPAGPLVVHREVLDATVGTERITLKQQNAARYDVPVSLLLKTDMQQAATLYRRLYPLLQRAYEDLGYPDRYFNDRVVETIDHLLATPEPAGPLLLEQPKVLYRFADADLEARSSGQKLLLRMGVAHARAVKGKLREFRGQISRKE